MAHKCSHIGAHDPISSRPVVCHCSRRFKNSHAHAQHLRHSPNHPPETTPGALVIDPTLAAAPDPFYMSIYVPAMNATLVTTGTICSSGEIVSVHTGLDVHQELEAHQTTLGKRAIATVKEKMDRRSENVLEQNGSQAATSGSIQAKKYHATPPIATGKENVNRFSMNLAEQSDCRATAASGSCTAKPPSEARSKQAIQHHETPRTPHRTPRKPTIGKANKGTVKLSEDLHGQNESRSRTTAVAEREKAEEPQTAKTTHANRPATTSKPHTRPRKLTIPKSERKIPGHSKILTSQGDTQATAASKSTPPRSKPHKTPLDRFFASFPTFPYDRSLPPATSYASLKAYRGWHKDDLPESEGKRAWKRYQSALLREVHIWFGKEDNLKAWHTLCKAIGISEPPATIPECEMAVRQTHVNIVDLIEWGRSGGESGSIKVFKTIEDLRDYTMSEQKIFPLANIENDEGETNIVLRHLLRKFPKRTPGLGYR